MSFLRYSSLNLTMAHPEEGQNMKLISSTILKYSCVTTDIHTLNFYRSFCFFHNIDLRLKTFFLNLHVFLCWIQNDTYSGLSRTIFSQNQIFTLYQYAQFILYTNIKQLNIVTVFNSIYISTCVFFMCEGYTELAPLVAIFCTNHGSRKEI
jgi:hypothetical protein